LEYRPVYPCSTEDDQYKRSILGSLAFQCEELLQPGFRDSIALPCLENIFFTGMLMSGVSAAILALHPLSLQILSVELSRWRYRRPDPTADNTPVDVVPVSVAHLYFSQIPLTAQSISEYIHLETNVEYLTLDLGSNWSINNPEAGFQAAHPLEMSGQGCSTTICDTLKPRGGFLPFPRLQRLTVSFPMEAEQEDNVLPLFSEVFNAREDAGGNIMVLTKSEQRKVEYTEPLQHPVIIGANAPTDYTLFRFTFQKVDRHPSTTYVTRC
jgi:hypothetical protein